MNASHGVANPRCTVKEFGAREAAMGFPGRCHDTARNLLHKKNAIEGSLLSVKDGFGGAVLVAGKSARTGGLLPALCVTTWLSHESCGKGAEAAS